jgi:fructose-1,6-bisphosphatase/inositol monophosphatase family enzyme
MIEKAHYVLTGVKIVRELHEMLRRETSRGEALRLRKIVVGDKKALLVDIEAENLCRREFEREFRGNIFVLGEESLDTYKEVLREEYVFALVDMLDGTDLFEMNIPLWCSAMVLLDPKVPEIIGAVVGNANGDIYFATAGEKATYVQRTRETGGDGGSLMEKCKGPSDVESLADARIAFYGQKAGNMLSVIEHKHLSGKLGTLKEQPFRIYNFAGNPVMLKLVDREFAEGEVIGSGFDAVFDLEGQKLHDMLPGAWLAMQAGAYLCDLNGNELTDKELAQRLLTPNETLAYVLASTKKLADELVSVLQQSK